MYSRLKYITIGIIYEPSDVGIRCVNSIYARVCYLSSSFGDVLYVVTLKDILMYITIVYYVPISGKCIPPLEMSSLCMMTEVNPFL